MSEEKKQFYQLTDYGRDLVQALPDRKRVAAVHRKYKKLKAKRPTK